MSNTFVHVLRKRRRGMTLLWAGCSLTLVMGMSMLALDGGRYWVARAQIQNAADAAARAAAGKMINSRSDAITAAQSAVTANKILGGTLTLSNQDIVFGEYDEDTGAFNASSSSPDAVRITVRMTSAQASSLINVLANAIGAGGTAMSASAIYQSYNMRATGPMDAQDAWWRIGQPDNWSAGSAGSTPPRTFIRVRPGEVIQIKPTGTWQLGQWGPDHVKGPEGYGQDWINDWAPSSPHYNGAPPLSNARAPLLSVTGFFVGDAAPTGQAPPALDFSTPQSREFTRLAPGLKQGFFVGDGLRSDGSAQTFVVPEGATKLYLAMNDEWWWGDNSGNMRYDIHVVEASPYLRK
jgi:Flp pilus assembly protein TadG